MDMMDCRLDHLIRKAKEKWNLAFSHQATELMGSHGPQMRIPLDQLAQSQQNVMLGPKDKNLKYMRLVLSTITHEQIGLQLRRCCRLR